MCSFLCMNIKLLRMYRSEQVYMCALTTSMLYGSLFRFALSDVYKAFRFEDPL